MPLHFVTMCTFNQFGRPNSLDVLLQLSFTRPPRKPNMIPINAAAVVHNNWGRKHFLATSSHHPINVERMGTTDQIQRSLPIKAFCQLRSWLWCPKQSARPYQDHHNLVGVTSTTSGRIIGGTSLFTSNPSQMLRRIYVTWVLVE